MHYNAPPNTTMHHIHTYVSHGPQYIHVYHQTSLCTRKILCTTCTSKHHMHHHAPHTHICTTWTTIGICVPQKILCTRKSSMYHMHHKTPPCTTYITKHHHAPPNITKNKINLVGLPSTISERPCQCDRSEVKQLILRIS